MRMTQMMRAASIARDVFGYEELRPFQEQVLRALLDEGRDVFAVAATGSGKSACFQLPALVWQRAVVVVSPLIALMKDQVDRLVARGVAAIRLSSDQDTVDEDQVRAARVMYASPERVATRAFQQLMRCCDIALIAVDEAHCAIEWRDFRSAYAQVREWMEERSEARRLICSATVTREQAGRLEQLFGLRSPVRVVTSPWRDNLAFAVAREASIGELARVVQTAQRADGAQIVYVGSRKAAEDVSAALREHGLSVAYYHGGMGAQARTKVQERFAQGAVRCVVATNAFGLGIDKPDIRLIAHWHVPAHLAAYLQEVGRASRDGKPGQAWLNLSSDGLRLREYLLRVSNPPHALYRRIWQLLWRGGGAARVIAVNHLARALRLKEAFIGQAETVLEFLAYRGDIRLLPVGQLYELPVINAAKARKALPKRARIVDGVLRLTVRRAGDALIAPLVLMGACRYAAPSAVVRIEFCTDRMRVTADDVAEKWRQAQQGLKDLRRFACAVDKRAFVESYFLGGGMPL